MTSSVRSVTVHLHADVDSYIARMRTAGRETDKAFGRSHTNIASTNRELGFTEQRLTLVDRASKNVRSSMLTLETTTGKLDRGVRGLNTDLRTLDRDGGRAGKQIDRLSGRMALFAQAAAVLGPAVVPIGAAAIPAIAGLTAEMGVAAGAAGVTLLAFHGLGDSMKALADYQADPTTEKLQKLNAELEKMGPAGAHFVRFLDDMAPKLGQLQLVARAGLFPGMEEGIFNLLDLLPQVRSIISELSSAMGEMARDAGKALAGPRFEEFFDYIQNTARPLLVDLSQTLGNFVDGFAAMLVAFHPISMGFADGFNAMSKSFADWAHGLSASDSFIAFVDYVQQSGPQVLDLLGSMVGAFVGIAEAAAPLGAVVVPALTALLDVIEGITKSDMGTPIFVALAAMSLLSRATALYGKVAATSFGGATIGSIRGMGSAMVTVTSATERATLATGKLTQRQTAMRGGFATLGKSAALMGGLALASSGAADSLAMSNTASMALMGTIAGPWGTAIGGGIGLAMDMAHANDDLNDSFKRLEIAMDSATPTPDGLAVYRAQIMETTKALDDFKAKINNSDSGGDSWNPFGSEVQGDLLRFKNTLEGWFGSSDVEEFQAKLDKAAAAEAKLRTQNTLLGASGTQLAWAIGRTALAADLEAASIDQMIESMRNARVEADRSFNAHLNYRASILDANDAIKENGRTVNENTRAGQANLQALSNLATAWNGQDDAAKNATGSLKAARQNFFRVADAMGMPIEQAKELAKQLFEIPPRTYATVYVSAEDALAHIRAIQSELDSLHANPIYVGIRGPGATGMGPQAVTRADGGQIHGPGGPRDDLIPALLSNREYVMPVQAVDHYGVGFMDRIRARKLADGGLASPARFAGGGQASHPSLEDRLAIAQALAQIRDLRRQLAADGKNKLEGLERRIAQLQILAAQKEIHLAQTREARDARQEARDKAKEARDKLRETRSNIRNAASSLSFDGIVPDQTPQTVAQQVATEIKDFRHQIVSAGGQWTEAMKLWAASMKANAAALDSVNGLLEYEKQHRDDLIQTLQDQQQALDQLNQTMQSYSNTVAGNFLHDPFNGAHTVTTDAVGTTPELEAKRAALASAEQQLAAIRSSAGGDSVASAAAASRLIAQIKTMRADVDAAAAAASQPVETTVTGLQSLRETLISDTKSAQDMATALQTLADKGLDTNGALGGLYQQLAASGDLATAQELAQLSAEQIDEYEALFAAREDAAAYVAAQATQAVYGAQQAQLMALITNTTAAIAVSEATIAVLNAEVAVLGEQVRDGAADGVDNLKPQLEKIQHAIENIPRQQQHHKRKAG